MTIHLFQLKEKWFMTKCFGFWGVGVPKSAEFIRLVDKNIISPAIKKHNNSIFVQPHYGAHALRLYLKKKKTITV